jgi:DNA processing protein
MSASADLVALSLLPLWWRRATGDRLRSGHAPDRILAALLAGPQQRPELTLAGLRRRAASALNRAEVAAITAVGWDDPSYPPQLAVIADPPPVLWVRGLMSACERPAVAIVGSRAGSSYALAVAERLAADLAERGVAIVSGLARGVDSAAHRGALSRGATIAVLGSGPDIVYPREHRALAEQIAVAGLVVSELAPGTAPQPQFFPLRNRIISGLSRAVVVVEAGERSGSLITARSALDQGRDVLAVPGNILTTRNRGGHALLRDGAKIVESADDILEELGLPGAALPGSESAGPRPGAARTIVQDPVLDHMVPGEPCDLDVLAERSGLTVARLLPRLLQLELQALVRREGGGRFVRFDRPC